jgi:hypothetical protein
MDKLREVKRINVSDFPRTSTGSDFGARAALINLFNYARQHPRVMDGLRANLKVMLTKIEQWDEVRKAAETEILAAGGKLRGEGKLQICHTHGMPEQVQHVQALPLYIGEPVAQPLQQPLPQLQPMLPAAASPLATLPPLGIQGQVHSGLTAPYGQHQS